MRASVQYEEIHPTPAFEDRQFGRVPCSFVANIRSVGSCCVGFDVVGRAIVLQLRLEGRQGTVGAVGLSVDDGNSHAVREAARGDG